MSQTVKIWRVTYKVTMAHVRETTVTVEKQQVLRILSVCL